MVSMDLRQLDRDTTYRLLTGIVIPRPIAFVTTLSEAGIVNAAPFSSLVTLSVEPAMVGFVIGSGGGFKKDTLSNIERTGEWVVNSVSEPLAEKIQRCAEPFPPELSELDEVGLTTIPSESVECPRVRESPIHLECKLERMVAFGDGPDRLVAGRVMVVHVDDEIVNNLKVDPDKWQPLGRIGGRKYCRVREFIDV